MRKRSDKVAKDKEKGLTKEELVEILRSSQDDGVRPAAVRELFNTKDDLTLKTETPPRMILPLVRMKILEAASDPDRKKSLIQVFVEEYDRRMISFQRKGRLELLGAYKHSPRLRVEKKYHYDE